MIVLETEGEPPHVALHLGMGYKNAGMVGVRIVALQSEQVVAHLKATDGAVEPRVHCAAEAFSSVTTKGARPAGRCLSGLDQQALLALTFVEGAEGRLCQQGSCRRHQGIHRHLDSVQRHR
ncbi:hypothetical protein D3C85_1023660 [compost metagenome]